MSDYQAYLLRMQRHPERTSWQVTLENVHTHEVQHFASLDEALGYLKHAARSSSLEDNSPIDARGEAPQGA